MLFTTVKSLNPRMSCMAAVVYCWISQIRIRWHEIASVKVIVIRLARSDLCTQISQNEHLVLRLAHLVDGQSDSRWWDGFDMPSNQLDLLCFIVFWLNSNFIRELYRWTWKYTVRISSHRNSVYQHLLFWSTNYTIIIKSGSVHHQMPSASYD